MSGVSVAVDETAREVSERQVLPAEGLREWVRAVAADPAYAVDGTPILRGLSVIPAQPPWNRAAVP